MLQVNCGEVAKIQHFESWTIGYNSQWVHATLNPDRVLIGRIDQIEGDTLYFSGITETQLQFFQYERKRVVGFLEKANFNLTYSYIYPVCRE